MKDKLIKILIAMAHLSNKLSALSNELDNLYDLIADAKFIEELEKITVKENADV